MLLIHFFFISADIIFKLIFWKVLIIFANKYFHESSKFNRLKIKFSSICKERLRQWIILCFLKKCNKYCSVINIFLKNINTSPNIPIISDFNLDSLRMVVLNRIKLFVIIFGISALLPSTTTCMRIRAAIRANRVAKGISSRQFRNQDVTNNIEFKFYDK